MRKFFSIHDGKPWEFPPIYHPLVSSTRLRPRLFRGTRRAASGGALGGALAPHPPCTTRSQPGSIQIFQNSTFPTPKTHVSPFFGGWACSALAHCNWGAVPAGGQCGRVQNRGQGRVRPFFCTCAGMFQSPVSRNSNTEKCMDRPKSVVGVVRGEA